MGLFCIGTSRFCKILFDAGSHERTVLDNSKVLKMDLSTMPCIVLSHNHWDHTIGWIPLRNEINSSHKEALSITHVARGIFVTRINSTGTEDMRLKKFSSIRSVG